MNAVTCRTRITANRMVHFVATGTGLTIASLFFLAPAASAVQMQLCELEQGPNGLQCVQQPKQFELCDLEQGPNGIQCVEGQLDEKAPEPGPDPEPPVDPEPQPEPGVDEAPEPKVAPDFEAQEPKAEEPVVSEAVDEAPEFEIAAGPAVDQPDGSSAGWVGLALLSSGLLWFYVRRRRQAQDDAVASLERM
jgi:LPXTG-motif cell wall-anchored protein